MRTAISASDRRTNRLLKKARLRRWPASPLAAAYRQYASLGLRQAALYLDLFEQPGKKRVFRYHARENRGGAGERGCTERRFPLRSC
jgi:hypothetical protein